MKTDKLNRLIFWVLLGMVILAPWQFYFRLGPSITLSVAQVFSILLIMLFLIMGGAKLVKKGFGRMELAVTVFWLAMLVSALIAPDKILSFKYFFKWSVPIFLFFISSRTGRQPSAMQKILVAVIGSAFIISLLGLAESFLGFNFIFNFVHKHKALVGLFTGPGPLNAFLSDNAFLNKMNWFYWLPDKWNYWVRPFGTFIAVSAFTLFVGLAGVFVPGFYKISEKRSTKYIYLLCGLIFILTIILTAARSAWLSLAMVFLGLFFLNQQKKKLFVYLLSVLLLLLISSLFITNFDLVFTRRISSIFQEGSTISRFRVWQQAIEIIKYKPLTGIGLANYDFGLRVVNPTSYLVVPAHNNYLQVWAEMGILGILALLGVIAQGINLSCKIIKRADTLCKTLGQGFLLMWIWFAVQSIFDTNIFDDKVAILFWILAGLNVALYNMTKTQEQGPKKENE